MVFSCPRFVWTGCCAIQMCSRRVRRVPNRCCLGLSPSWTISHWFPCLHLPMNNRMSSTMVSIIEVCQFSSKKWILVMCMAILLLLSNLQNKTECYHVITQGSFILLLCSVFCVIGYNNLMTSATKFKYCLIKNRQIDL